GSVTESGRSGELHGSDNPGVCLGTFRVPIASAGHGSPGLRRRLDIRCNHERSRRAGPNSAATRFSCGGIRRSALALHPHPALDTALEPEPSGLLEIARDIEQHAPLHGPSTGSDALTAVLCAIADTLDAAEVRDLADLLPPDLRPVLAACSFRDGEGGI